MTKQDLNKLLRFFSSSSKRDMENFRILKKSKRFDAALFFLHLALEKRIKHFIVKQTKGHPPFSHDLVFLMARTHLEPSEEWLAWFRTISSFNLATRYENERFEFYKKATAKFVGEWEKKAKRLLAWIDEEQKKI